MAKKSGLIRGADSTSHKSGNDIPVVLVETGKQYHYEGDEYVICASALENHDIHEFKSKTNHQILDHIYKLFSCHNIEGQLHNGDFVICKIVVRDKAKRNITGTIREILNIMQAEHSCKTDAVKVDYTLSKGGQIPKKVTIPFGKLISNIPKLEETLLDINEGRLSHSPDVAPTVSYVPSMKKYLLMDGNHRVLEKKISGATQIEAEINPWVPKTYNLSHGVEFISIKDFDTDQVFIPNNDEENTLLFKGGPIKGNNLTDAQLVLIRTPEFKAWFGDWEDDPKNASKIVDKNGFPLVVYHSTNKEFTEFDPQYQGINTEWENTKFGFFFIADKQLAINFAKETHQGDIIISAFLSIKKPMNISNAAIFTNEEQAPVLYKLMMGRKIKGDKALRWFDKNIGLGEIGDLRDQLVSDEAKELFIKEGYDGMISEFGDKNLEYVAFYPTQIKLSDGSNTSFDAENPDIRLEKGGSVDISKEKLIGGKADNMSLYDIAKFHNVPLAMIQLEFETGLEEEKEHTEDIDIRSEIVKDHLMECPEYYTKLNRVMDNQNNLSNGDLIQAALDFT